MEERDFDRLLDLIHAAGLDAARWPDALAALRAQVDGAKLCLSAQDTRGGPGLGTLFAGYPDEAHADFLRRYGAINPFAPAALRTPVGTVLPSDRLVAHRELRRTEFYDGFFRPYGDLGPGAGGLLARDGARVAILSGHCAFAHEDRLVPRLVAVLGAVAPHVRRALETGARLGRAALAAGVEQSPRAVILLGAGAQALAASPRAEAILSAPGGPERRARGALTLGDAAADRWLADAARRFDTAPDRPGTDAMRLPGPGPAAAFLDPLPARRAAERTVPSLEPAAARAVAVLSFAAPPDSRARAEQVLGAVWGLTPAERRVALAVAEGMAPCEIAACAGTTDETVKSQLRAAFRKTGTGRQTALAALVHELS